MTVEIGVTRTKSPAPPPAQSVMRCRSQGVNEKHHKVRVTREARITRATEGEKEEKKERKGEKRCSKGAEKKSTPSDSYLASCL